MTKENYISLLESKGFEYFMPIGEEDRTDYRGYKMRIGADGWVIVRVYDTYTIIWTINFQYSHIDTLNNVGSNFAKKLFKYSYLNELPFYIGAEIINEV